MSSAFSRPARRAAAFDMEPDEAIAEQQEFHAPNLHEDCAQCEAALLESIEEGLWQTEESDPFNTYRHFHPLYSFNYYPYEHQFRPVALAGKTADADLRVGDIVLMRSTLSNKTRQAIITDPQLRSHQELGITDAQKPGWYVRALGNHFNDGNKTGYIRIQDSRYRTPDDIIIIRKINRQAASENAEAIAEADEIKEYVKYTSSMRGGYVYYGDRSLNYDQIIADSNLSDFEARTAKHFTQTEGGIDSINTYDNQVITWGIGFSGWAGNLTKALYYLLSSNEQARNEFNSYGITLTSVKVPDLSIAADGKTHTGYQALRFWRLSKPYLNILVHLSQKYATDTFKAQWKTFKEIHASVFKAFNDPSYLSNIANETERNKAKAAVLHAHHHYPGYNPASSFRYAASLEEVLNIYVQQSSRHGSVQGHANNWRQNLNKVFSGSAPSPVPVPPSPTPVPPNPMPPVPTSSGIRGSVGKGGQNNPDDVLKIQTLLNAVGIVIPINGQMYDSEGDVTVLAIYHYQAKKKFKWYDGRIDPNGPTFKALIAEGGLSI
jgi:hypothetical protein